MDVVQAAVDATGDLMAPFVRGAEALEKISGHLEQIVPGLREIAKETARR